MAKIIQGSFDAAGQTSDHLNGHDVVGDRRAQGVAHISISGTFTATVKLQVRWNDQQDQPWHDTGDTWTAPAQGSFRCSDNADYRLAVDAYTSGTVSYRVGV